MRVNNVAHRLKATSASRAPSFAGFPTTVYPSRVAYELAYQFVVCLLAHKLKLSLANW